MAKNGSFTNSKFPKFDFTQNLRDRKILKFPHCENANWTVPLQLDFLHGDDELRALLEVLEQVHLLGNRLQCLCWKADKTWMPHVP